MHENNEILLTVNLDMLSRALRSASTSDDVEIKLTKRHDTRYLAIKIGIIKPTGASRPIVQEIPIELCVCGTAARTVA